MPTAFTAPMPVTTTRRRATLHPHPAVDRDDRAGDVGGVVREQEPHDARDVVGIAEPLQRGLARGSPSRAASGSTSVSSVVM